MLTHIQKINSVYTFFNINNSNIFKTNRFLHYIIATITKIWSITKVFIINVSSAKSLQFDDKSSNKLCHEVGLREAQRAPPLPPPPIFCNYLFFAITLKNCKLSYLKLNRSLIMHLYYTFTQILSKHL